MYEIVHSTPTSLWCYCSNALKWNARDVFSNFDPFCFNSPDVHTVEPSTHGFWVQRSLDSKHWKEKLFRLYVMKLIYYAINMQMIFYFIFLQYISI